jgi:uncharacterized Zn finger protein
MTTKVTKVATAAIRERVGDRKFPESQRYYRDGALSDLRREGATIRGYCQGQMAQPYRVEVTLGPKRVVSASCSCPVGDGGCCKHVGALLLAWQHEPDEFREVEALDAALARRSKDELVALVKQMVRRQPDLELLLDAPVPGGAGVAPDPDVYRRQAEAAFRHHGNEWGSIFGIAAEVRSVLETGDAFLEKGQWAHAAAVFQGVQAAVSGDNGSIYDDEEGELSGVAQDCADGLIKCLEAAEGPGREGVLRALFDCLRADLEAGGLGVSDEIPDAFRDLTTPEERARVAGWVRSAVESARADSWQRETFGGLLLDLEAEDLDDESYLEVCRQTGRREDLVERLLKLGRVDEAAAEAARVEEYQLLRLADIFAAAGHGDRAEAMVRERSGSSNFQFGILEWLKKRALERKDKAEALRLAGELFRIRPDQERYGEIRKLVGQAAWPERRTKLIAELRKAKADWLLIDIFLKEGEHDEALELVRRPTNTASVAKVAEAVQATHPAEAAALYARLAETEIAQRSRDHYAEACRQLRKMRKLLRQLDRGAEWDAHIARVRADNPRLRALHEEMTRAGLDKPES